MNNEENLKLPYHADIPLFGKILDDLKTSGKEGISISTLWVNIGGTNKNMRSFTINLGKYVGLFDSDGKKIWLTDFGSTLQYMSKDERGKALASKLPEKYLTMFKWIRNDGELRSTEIKRKFIETWSKNISTPVLDRTVTTFLNYCDWLGIITYQGRGNQAKAIITDLGKRALEISSQKPPTQHLTPQEIGNIPVEPTPDTHLSLPKEAVFPIIIKTRDRIFNYDMKTELDLKIIDTVIDSIKDDWSTSQKKQQSKKENVKNE